MPPKKGKKGKKLVDSMKDALGEKIGIDTTNDDQNDDTQMTTPKS